MNMLEECIVFFIWAAWILNFILCKKKSFQSEILLETSSSSPSRKKFGLDGFLTSIWLPLGQLWAIIEETAPLT